MSDPRHYQNNNIGSIPLPYTRSSINGIPDRFSNGVPERYPFNNPHPRPSVPPMAQGFPDTKSILKQLAAQEDIKDAQDKYNMPRQVGTSGNNTFIGDNYSVEFGFTTQGFILDSAMPRYNANIIESDNNNFKQGILSFDFPRIGSITSISNIVGLGVKPFFLPRIFADNTIHPDFYYNQFVGLQIGQLNTDTNVYQPIQGNGPNYLFSTGVPSASSVQVLPMEDRIAFNQAVQNINRFDVRIFRLSSRPGSLTMEPIALPMTNVSSSFIGGSGNVFRLNAATASEFISQAGYTAGTLIPVNITAIHTNDPLTNVPDAAEAAIFSPNGWYASGLDYVNNTFMINGINLNTFGVPANAVFIITIMPNRITIPMTFISRTGTITNNLTVTY